MPVVAPSQAPPGAEPIQITGHRDEIWRLQYLGSGTRWMLTGSTSSLVAWTATPRVTSRRLVEGDRLFGYSLSPDASRVVVATPSGGRILKVATGEVETGFGDAPWQHLLWPEWSPAGDLIATKTRREIHLWRWPTGDHAGSLALADAGARGPVQLAWSPDGARLAALGRVGRLLVFRIRDGALEFDTQAHDVVSAHLRWSPDGSMVATGANDGLVKLWSAEDWKLLLSLENAGNLQLNGRSPIDALEFSPGGDRVAVAVPSASLRIWSTRSGEELFHWSNTAETPYEPHRGQVRAMAFSPDGGHLVTAGTDNFVKVWNLASGMQAANTGGFLGSIDAVAWSPDGQTYAAASRDGTAAVWDALTHDRVTRFQGHASGTVQSLSFAPGVSRLVTCGTDGEVRIWSARSGVHLFDVPAKVVNYGTRSEVVARPAVRVAYSPASNRVALFSDYQSGRALEIRRVTVSVGPPARPWYSVEDAAWSPDGRRMAVATYSEVSLVDLAEPDQYPVMLRPGSADLEVRMQHVSWSSDGTRVLAASNLGATSWDWSTGRVVAEVRPEEGAVYVEESADGSLLLTLSGSFRRPVAQVWDVSSQAELAAIVPERWRIAEARFLPDGRRMLVRYSRNPSPSVLDALSGEELHALVGHRFGVRGFAVSPDGGRIATAGADRTVRLWDAGTGKELMQIQVDLQAVRGVEFSPDGMQIAAYGVGGARIFSAPPTGQRQ